MHLLMWISIRFGTVVYSLTCGITKGCKMGEQIVLISHNCGGGIMNKGIMNVVSLKKN